MDKRSSIDCKICANRQDQKICDLCCYGELFAEAEPIRFDEQEGPSEYLSDYGIENDN